MVDLPFLIVVAVTLAFLSLLVALRMQASGATAAQLTTVIAELWAVFATWIAVLSVVTGRGGWSGFVRRFVGLSPAGKALTGAALACSLALFVHLQWTLRRAMPGGGGGGGEGD